MKYKEFVPRPYQAIGISHFLEHKRAALWAGMGMGKTSITLSTLDALYMAGYASRPSLVLAPLRVARSTWGNEAAKWDVLHHIEVCPIVGEAKHRMAVLRKALRQGNGSVFTINYENLVWLEKALEELKIEWPFGQLVSDESTRLKSLRISMRRSPLGKLYLQAQGGSVRARVVAKIAHKHVDRWYNLTGTPAPNGLIDLWGQTWPLDGGQRLGRSFDAFKQRWFQAIPGGDGYSQVRPLAHAHDEIQERLKDICLTLDPKDYFDLREPIVTKIEVDLPTKAAGLYRQMERELFFQLAAGEVEAFNAGAKTMKCRQIANGFVYIGEPTPGVDRAWEPLHDAKLEALESVIEEAAGAPVIVAYQFKPDLAMLKKRFPQGRELRTAKDEEDFKAGKIPVLFMHPASAAHGIDGFQYVCNIICYYADDWNLELYQQILERIGPVRQLQAGLERPVYVYIIVAKGTVDEDMLVRRETKAEVQDVLKDAMKRRK